MFNQVRTQGLALIWILIVSAVVGVLALIVLSKTSNLQSQTRDSFRVNDMKQIRTALEMFRTVNGRYPDSTNDNVSTAGEYIGVGDDIDRALLPYLNPIPIDPLHDGTVYFYSYDSRHYVDTDCELPAASAGLVYGFNKAEAIGENVLEKDTCLGGDMNLNNADFNQAVIRTNY